MKPQGHGFIAKLPSLEKKITRPINPLYPIELQTLGDHIRKKRLDLAIEQKDVAKRIKPEFNTPIVTYLCSEENRESGMIFTMSAGWFARSAIVSGKGCCIGDTIREITAEEIHDQFHEIKNIDRAKPYDNCGEIYQLGQPLTGR